MKKIFSLFVALTAMVAVNAADYYLVGGFCGWNTGNAVKFTEVSAGNYGGNLGKYKLYLKEI